MYRSESSTLNKKQEIAYKSAGNENSKVGRRVVLEMNFYKTKYLGITSTARRMRDNSLR